MYAERGNKASELDYDAFCGLLRESGVSTLRVFVSNWSNPIGSYVAAFEPPPHGSFNPWLDALDPRYMSLYHASQFTSVEDNRWPETNMGRFIEACDAHGIGLILALFDRVEWDAGWVFNSWNADCQYIDGRRADPQDRGFLARSRDIFVTEAGWDATRRRIDFVLSAFAGKAHVIQVFEVCAEEPFYVRPETMGTGGWNAEFAQWVEHVHQWNLRVQDYLHERHPAPCMLSAAVLADDLKPTLFDGMDIVGVNWYETTTPETCHAWLRRVQARYPDAQPLMQQYHPDGANVGTEAPPYTRSGELEFTGMCGCGVGTFRWVDRFTGTYCTPELRQIAGVTRHLVAAAQFKQWQGLPRSWDDRITGAPFVSSCGDGKHVVCYAKWPGDGQAFTVSGLSGQQVVLNTFETPSGEPTGERAITLTGDGSAVFTVPGQGSGAFCITPVEGPTPEPVRTIRVRAVVEVDEEPAGMFEGILEEVT
jgi:hypothetical protein